MAANIGTILSDDNLTSNKNNKLKKPSNQLPGQKQREYFTISYDNKGLPKVSTLVDKNIYINTNDKCESLNVSVAASIIMYEINKEW